MQDLLRIQNLFLGGIAESKYVSSRNSVASMVGLDISSELGLIKLNQNLKALTGAEAPDEEVIAQVSCTNGYVYFFSGESGKIWSLSPTNVWNLEYTTAPLSGSAIILDATEYSGYLYWSTEKWLHRIRVSKLSTFSSDVEPNWKPLFLDQQPLGYDVDSKGYAVYTSISEVAIHKKEFKPIEDTLSAISVMVKVKASVNLTVTVHNSANSSIASATINNASLVDNAINRFSFSPVAVDPDETYHIHITGNTTGAYVGTANAEMGPVTVTIASPGVVTFKNHGLAAGDQIYFTTDGALPTGITAYTPYYVIATDLTTNTFKFSTSIGGGASNTSGSQSGFHKLHNPRFSEAYAEIYSKSTSLFHSFAEANGVLYIGDRNYIHQVEDDFRTGEHVFSYFALDIPKHYIISAIKGNNTSLIIGTFAGVGVKKASVFWWNTYSTVSYSYEDEIEEEGIWSFFTRPAMAGTGDDSLFASAGTEGRIYQYIQGKLVLYTQLQGVFDANNKGYIKLNAHTFFLNRMMIGFSTTDGDPIRNGIYSIFSARPGYSPITNLEYTISTRNAGELVMNEIQISSLCVRDGDLIVCWKNNSDNSVGVDIIDWDNKHDKAGFVTGIIKSEDLEEMRLRQLIVDYKGSIPTGTDIELQYYKNHSNTPSVPDQVNDDRRCQKRAVLSDDCITFQAEVLMTHSGNDAPEIFGLLIGLE